MTDLLTSRSPLSAAELEAWTRDGYHVARGLFGAAEVAEIRKRFDAIGSRGQRIPDHWEPDTDADDVFKPPGARGQAVHQDNYYLRVPPYTCVAAWVASTSSTENGGLEVSPARTGWARVPRPRRPVRSFVADYVAPPPGHRAGRSRPRPRRHAVLHRQPGPRLGTQRNRRSMAPVVHQPLHAGQRHPHRRLVSAAHVRLRGPAGYPRVDRLGRPLRRGNAKSRFH